jgi:hypothetical protein
MVHTVFIARETKMKNKAKQIIRDFENCNTNELAMHLFNSSINSPSFSKCKKIIIETKKELKKRNGK